MGTCKWVYFATFIKFYKTNCTLSDLNLVQINMLVLPFVFFSDNVELSANK